MYWPNGVPRVYAVNGPSIPPASSDDDTATESEGSRLQGEAVDNNGSQSHKPSPWAEEPITGLCVTRGGHIFATMTDSSIAVWQTRVCLSLSSLTVC